MIRYVTVPPMDPGIFHDASTGRVVPIGAGRHAYVPAPLLPDLRLSEETILVLAHAAQAVGALNGMGQLLPAPYLLIDPALHREAVLSSRIEGTQASIADVLLREAVPVDRPKDDVQEVINYVSAMRHGLVRMQELPLCLNLVREIHGVLMEGVRGAHRAAGEFRRIQNHIGPPGTPMEMARYVPPPVDEMGVCLDDWERTLHEPSRHPSLVMCAVLHYQFEAIHPFLDGNGRLGRLISILYLIDKRVLDQPLLNLSIYFESDRTAYYDGLLSVSTSGTWDAWVRYFLQGVAEGATAAVADCQRLFTLRDDLRSRLTDEHARPTAHRLLDLLFTNPFVTAKHVADTLNVSGPAAQAAIKQMADMGLLDEITGRPRHRVYVARDVLAAIEGTPRPKPARAAAAEAAQETLPLNGDLSEGQLV